MARPFITIAQEIYTRILADPLFAGADTSVASEWKSFADAVADTMSASEQLADLHEADLQAIADAAPTGTPPWLRQQALLWQPGDTLVLDPNTLRLAYATVNPASRIITSASVRQVDNSRTVLVKVAKQASGLFAPLSATELTQFRAYMNRLKFAGQQLQILSVSGDTVTTFAEVYYNGELDLVPLRTAVLAAYTTFLSSLEFDGTLLLTALVDTIQRVPGVRDVKLGTVSAVDALNQFTLIARSYQALAGWCIPVTGSNAPTNTFTFLPYTG